MNSIKLNDILRLDNLSNVKIRFNLMFAQNWNPIELFKNGDISTMLAGQYWNYNKNKSYKTGLTIVVRLNLQDYQKGIKVDKTIKEDTRIQYHPKIPDLNYRINP